MTESSNDARWESRNCTGAPFNYLAASQPASHVDGDAPEPAKRPQRRLHAAITMLCRQDRSNMNAASSRLV